MSKEPHVLSCFAIVFETVLEDSRNSAVLYTLYTKEK